MGLEGSGVKQRILVTEWSSNNCSEEAHMIWEKEVPLEHEERRALELRELYLVRFSAFLPSLQQPLNPSPSYIKDCCEGGI